MIKDFGRYTTGWTTPFTEIGQLLSVLPYVKSNVLIPKDNAVLPNKWD